MRLAGPPVAGRDGMTHHPGHGVGSVGEHAPGDAIQAGNVHDGGKQNHITGADEGSHTAAGQGGHPSP